MQMIKLKIESMGNAGRGELEALCGAGARLLPGLWAGDERYRDSMGWLDPEEWAPPVRVEQLQGKAKEVREKAQALVLIGVGGSNKAARALVTALEPEGIPIVYAGNTLSPHSMRQVIGQWEGKSFYINVIAKNFETLEPGVAFRTLRAVLEGRYGGGAAKRILVTGTPGSRLQEMAGENGYDFLTFPDNIGGRYSALCDVGLFPMAAAGVDIAQVVRGAVEMRCALRTDGSPQNPAVRYAAFRNLWYQQGKRLEMLSIFEPRLGYLGEWWVQLFAESQGKRGMGLFPVLSKYSEDLHSVGQYVQEGAPILLETFLQVEDPEADVSVPPSLVQDGFQYLEGKDYRFLNRAAEEATMQAHSSRLPCLRLSVPRIDAYHLGQLLYFFEFSCYLSSEMLGVNPFDQPGVEAYKQAMSRRLRGEAI